MREAISEIVGEGKLSSGESAQVYRALQPLFCSTCGAAIARDVLFTRRGVKGFRLSIMPQCRKCAPFVLEQSKPEPPEPPQKSELLQALLGHRSADSAGREDAPASVSPDPAAPEEEDVQRDVAEEVRRRLGPALKSKRRQLK